MNSESADQLLLALGSKRSGQSGAWVRGSCPLAPWLHKSGKDSSPSFGLFVEEGSPGRFHCFTCESGGLPKLLQTIEMFSQKQPGTFSGNLTKAREIIEASELELPMLPDYSEFGTDKKKAFEELPEYVLESFVPVSMSARAQAYCVQRGITAQEAIDFDLRYDHDSDMLAFPYWDVFGRFAGVRGRGVTLYGENGGRRHHDYVFNGVNNSGLVFYNERALNLPGPVVLVEGQIDTIKVARLWPKTVGNLTAKPILDKVSKLGQTDGVITLLDGDATGRRGTQKFCELLTFLNIPTLPIYLPWDEQTGVKSDPDSVGAEYLLSEFRRIGLLDKT